MDGGASVVPQVRRWVRSLLSENDPAGVPDDVELVVTRSEARWPRGWRGPGGWARG